MTNPLNAHPIARRYRLATFGPPALFGADADTLDQLLYALRSSLGDTVFDGVNPVRLNPDVAYNDVGALNTALERGDLEAAVNEYRGAFRPNLARGPQSALRDRSDSNQGSIIRSGLFLLRAGTRPRFGT